ncbi:TolB family protein [Streptomyces sp. NPDC059468]|uniref:TolB family protein n=1 Tax=Streptomyces sp. NPDC059468 TaxID=3346845 RepID=UPI00367FB8E9
MTKRNTRLLTVIIILGHLAALAALAALAILDARAAGASSRSAATGTVSIAPGPRLLARSTAADSQGRLVAVPANAPGGRRVVSTLSCSRLYAAGGTGLCLRLDPGLTTYQLVVLDRRLKPLREIPLVGVPNRARVSPSGRLVAWTVFVAGDSYNGGRFSTRVGILDTRTQELIPTLENWKVTVSGNPYKARDLNFWGVTFAADDRRFYATMSTSGHRYLVLGDLATHRLRTVRDNVECPSLSPDGTRIAFKSAVGGDPHHGWRLSVLDLATHRVTPLAETRSVDDQAAWLDEHSVAYSLPRGRGHADVWSVPADGTGTPRRIIPDAESPAALDPALQKR